METIVVDNNKKILYLLIKDKIAGELILKFYYLWISSHILNDENVFLSLNITGNCGQVNRQVHVACSEKGHDLAYTVKVKKWPSEK